MAPGPPQHGLLPSFVLGAQDTVHTTSPMQPSWPSPTPSLHEHR